MPSAHCAPFIPYSSRQVKSAATAYEVALLNIRGGQATLFDTPSPQMSLPVSEERQDLIRHDGITDKALEVFRRAYPGNDITKERIFYYVYGILHSPDYRERFENNLAKGLPRIPLAKDFNAFCLAGRRLADLHLHYEEPKPWEGLEEDGDTKNPGRTQKMAWGKTRDPETGKICKDYTVLAVAENMTIRNIPVRAQEYKINGRYALEWLVDRYRVKTDKKSGIVNDPNSYSRKPRCIVDLVKSVVRVSMETLEIMGSLPTLEELPQIENWPLEWRAV